MCPARGRGALAQGVRSPSEQPHRARPSQRGVAQVKSTAMLLFLFVLLPVAEFTALYFIGREIGVLNLIAAVVLAGVLGGAIARTRGFSQWREWQRAVSAGKMPDEGVSGGLLILAACLFLILPGFVSDLIALALLIPPIRRQVARRLSKRWKVGLEARQVELRKRAPPNLFGEKEVGGKRLDSEE